MDERTPVSRHPHSIVQVVLWALLASLTVLLIALPAVSDAQVVTNITSSGLNTTVTQAGNLYNITEGTRPGSGPNLFHSFGDFSVGPGDIGNFLNNTGLPTSNIFGRVTGGNISTIYGTIQTTGFGNANLFLVNPSGIVLGPTGSVNVGGSVSFTTAQYLRLFDEVNSANFYADPANDGLANSVLAVAPVVDFGFLSPAAYGFLTSPDPSPTITAQGSALSVPSGQSISLVGGKVVIEGGAQFSAPSGSIKLATAASPGEFDVNTLQSLPNVDGASFTSSGTINMAAGSSIDVHGNSSVFIKGGQLVLSMNDSTLNTSESPAPPDTISLSPSSSIVTSNSGAEPGADVQMTAVVVQMDGATIQSINSGDLDGGNISINAGIVNLTNSSLIQSTTGLDFTTGAEVGLGKGGNVVIQGIQGVGSAAESAILSNFSQIASITFGSGHGGETSIRAARTFVMTEGASMFTGGFGTGRPGDILLSAQQVSLSVGATIRPENSPKIPFPDLELGNPSTGKVTVQGLQGAGSQADALILDGAGTGIISQLNSPGRAGEVDVHAKTVILTDGASIQSGSQASLASGANVTIDADSVAITGRSLIKSQAFNLDGGQVTITANQLTVNNSLIDTSTVGLGRGGNVALNVGSVSLTNGARIDSSTSDTGLAGTITITAHTLALANIANIAADTHGAAPAGDINLNVDTLTADNNSTISSTSFLADSVAGNAGNITIQGITGSGSPATNVGLDSSFISTEIFGGNAATPPGAIEITAQKLEITGLIFEQPELNPPGLIRANTNGAAPAGNITLNVGTLTVGHVLFAITSESTESEIFRGGGGNAGNIAIQGITGSGSPAANVVLGRTIISTDIFGGSAANTAASIEITARTLTLADGVIIQANTGGVAPAGNITLNLGTLTSKSPFTSHISSSAIFPDSTAGNAGNITIQGITGSGSPAANVVLDNSVISTLNFGGSAATPPGAIEITADTLTLANGAVIRADTTGDAPGGDIAVNVRTLTAAGHSEIASNSGVIFSDFPTGNAGNITIQGITGSGSPAASVRLDSSVISTQSFGGSAANTAASIEITAQTLTLVNGADIRAETAGAAPAGDIVLHGGMLTSDSSTISTRSTSTAATPGNAGSIELTSANDLFMRNSTVTTSAGQASGGNIRLTAPDLIRLVDSTITSSVQGTAGSNGGNINIDPQWVVIQNSNILANANAGAGGNITIAATGAVLIDPNSLLSASAGPAGVSGSVNINSPIQVLGGIFVPLNLAYSQAALSGDRCAADPTGQFSSFVQTGRDGVPQVPGALSPSPLSFLETLTSSSLGSPSPNWTAARLGLDSVRIDESTQFLSTCRS